MERLFLGAMGLMFFGGIIGVFMMTVLPYNLELNISPEEAMADTELPSTVKKFSDGHNVCYIYVSDYLLLGNTSRVGGISCVKGN